MLPRYLNNPHETIYPIVKYKTYVPVKAGETMTVTDAVSGKHLQVRVVRVAQRAGDSGIMVTAEVFHVGER